MKKFLLLIFSMLTMTAGILAQQPAILKAWFPFDGDFLDYSGNNYHGTNMNTTWTTDKHGNPNKALSFNGNTSGVRLDNGFPLVFDGSLTFSCWVYFNDDSRGILFGSYNTAYNVNFEKHTGFKLRIYWNDGTPEFFTAPNVVSANAWYFLTFIRDVSTNSFRIFVNGQLVESFSGVGSNIFPAGPFYIGRDSRTGNTVVNGKMDDVRIYYGALSDTEVLALYKETANVVDFTADVNAGITPLTVNFTDQSQVLEAPITEWLWYFGDGDSSSVQNPTHIYENSGNNVLTYSVSLGVKDANDSVSVMVKDNFIQVFPNNYIPGGNVSGVWTAASSPYFVGGEIVVPFGDTLIIEPGVIVKFKTNSIDYFNYQEELTPDNTDFGYMTVYGTLIVQGTGADSIVFTRAGDTGWWGMIHLTKDANTANAIEYCKMEYASFMNTDTVNAKEVAGLSFDRVDATIRYNRFCNNVIGVFCDSSNAIISENTFSENQFGINCDLSDAIISENAFFGNVYGIQIISESAPQISYNSFFEGGCAFYAPDGEGCEPVIDHNIFETHSRGIWLNNTKGSTISNNTINNCSNYGIIISNSPTFIDGNTISVNRYGIGLTNSNAEIINNTIQANTRDGILCQQDSSIITDNIISGNGWYGIRYNQSFSRATGNQIFNHLYDGIYGMDSDSLIIKDNTLSGNQDGIFFRNSNVEIENNTITSNNRNGIYCYDNSSYEIIGNTIETNTMHGIRCSNDTSFISGNTISGNGSSGIWSQHSFSTIHENQIHDNANYGIFCEQSDSLTITENTISGNLAEGILCIDNSGMQIRDNTITSNHQNGISCLTSVSLIISGNAITENFFDGIFCLENSGLEILENTFEDNTNNGIRCLNDSSLISGNTISGHSLNGIDFDHSFSTVSGNEIMNNDSSGIYCENSPMLNIAENTISANDFGISLHHSNSEISNNTIMDNTQYGIRCEYDTTIISGNHISANKYGIGYNHSYSNSFGNEILNNQLGIYSLYSDTLTFTADSISSNGRGIFNYYSTMQVDSCIISFNSSAIEDYQSNTVITDCIIDSNSIGIKGNSTSISVSNTKISNNGYGIYCENSSLTAYKNQVFNNNEIGILTTSIAGLILGEHIISENTISGNTEGGVFCMYFEKLTFENNEILDNGVVGVGIDKSWNPTSSTHVNNNVISGNNGVGLNFSSAHNAYVNNNTISNNEETGLLLDWPQNFHANNNIISDNWEFGVLMEGQGLEFVNNTIVNNGWGGVKSEGNNSTDIISNSIIWGNNGAYGNIGGDGVHTVIYSCVENGYAGEGNIDSNPLLDEDYHLTWANFPDDDATKSPCIDSGDTLNWLNNPSHRDPDQSRMDMGARYYHQEPAVYLLNPDGVHGTFDFGDWEVGTMSDYEPFEVSNLTGCFNGVPVFLAVKGNPQFIMENLADTLFLEFQPFESKTFGVAFKPTLTGQLQDTLNAGYADLYPDVLRLKGRGLGSGNVTGHVMTQNNVGVPGVTITVSGGNTPIIKTGTTANDGYYFIANIGWGDFTITPEKYEDTIAHVFYPADRTGTTSDPSHTTIEDADFQDISYFTVSGNISYLNTTCPVEDVHVLMDNEIAAITDSAGNFTIYDVQVGVHTFKPDTAGGRRFYPAQIIDTLFSPLAGMQFTDSLTYKLSGYVAGGGIPLPDSLGGGCSVPLTDSVQLLVECLNSCGIGDTTIFTDTLGYYSIMLAPGHYEITPEPFVYNNTAITFDTKQVDLSEGAVTRDFIYHTDPQMTISGFDALPEFKGLKILEQFEIYTVAIDIYEPYGDIQCPVTSGTVMITDNLSDVGGEVDVPVSDSGTYYTFMAGYPNIWEPYTKVISFEYENESGNIDTYNDSVYITGQVPRETAFATTMPQRPLMILRDPPGDMSYSVMNNTTSISNSYSIGTKHQDDTSAFVKASLCLKWEMKFLFGIKLKIEENFSLEGGFKQSVTQNSITQNQTTVTNSTTYKTSDDGFVVGRGGDVYMGGAMNLLYGVTDVLSISGDSIWVDQDIIFAPNGFATKYVYTEYQIINDIIPDLLRIEDYASAQDWQDILDYNQQLKDQANMYEENVSISSGATQEVYKTMTRSATHTKEFELMIDTCVAAEIGLKINGLGIGGGGRISNSMTIGESWVDDTLNSTTIGYYLKDGDPLDVQSINIKTDRVYGTPVFETVSGETSCPFEEGTVPRQGCQLTIEPNEMWNVPAGGTATFEVNLINTSQTEENLVPCFLQLLNNPYGLNITNNGSLANGREFDLNYGDSTIFIYVGMPPTGDIYDFEGITFRLSPTCEKEIAQALGVIPNLSDEVTFDVHFSPPCSPISIQSPNNGWVVNQASNNILPVTITGYDTLNPELQSVGLEYYTGGYWIEVYSILKDSIQSPILNVDLDMGAFPDGELKIRAVVKCVGEQENYSQTRSGIIDRTPPMVYGNPQPFDGLLNIGDGIYINFNEKLDASSITINSCKILDVESGLTAGANVQYFVADNKVLLTLNPENLYFLEGLLLKTQIVGIKDQYGNAMADTASWSFLVDLAPLNWSENNFVFTINDGDSISFSSTLENVSSKNHFYWIDLPEWLTATPDTGTLYSFADTARIQFVSQALPGGIYYDTIYAGALGYPAEEIHIMIQTAGGPELVVNPFSQEVLASAGTTTFDIISNVNWTVSEDVDWLSVDPYGGSDNGALTVNFGENNTGSIRVGEITVTAADGLLVAVVTVTQKTWLIHSVNLPQGWSGLSSYITPYDPDIENIFDGILDNLVIAMTQQDMYYPANEINTIDNWAHHSAYKVKTNAAVTLNIIGAEPEPERTLTLENGWNLIPVISECEVDVETLFDPVVDDLVIVKEVAGWGLYWPAYAINTLGVLDPGKAYYVLMNASESITFPDCGSKGAAGFKESRTLTNHYPSLKAFSGITAPTPTPLTHSIAITGAAQQMLKEGSIIGAYDQAGNCFGMTVTGDESVCLTVFGNDQLSDVKDGFDPGEAILFKPINPLIGEESLLSPTFDQNMPANDGTFTGHGLSVITGFEAFAGISAPAGAGSVNIFPNPTTGMVNITGLSDDATITVMNIQGRELWVERQKADGLLILNLANHKPGVYLIKIEQNGEVLFRKLVLK